MSKHTVSTHTVRPMSDREYQDLIDMHDREGGYLAIQGARQSQGCWDSGIKIIKECGHMNIPAYLIRFSQLAHEKIECLKRSYPSLEWLAYLEGRVDHVTREVFVDDLIIPDSQVVTGSHVGEVEYGWNSGKLICGVIHSHNTMGAFFSGTDDAYINQNHDVSICVSTAHGREICAQVRVKTPCGSYIINSNVKFKIDFNQILDEKAFVAEFSPRIRTPRIIFQGGGRQTIATRKGVQDVNSVRGGQCSTASIVPAGSEPELQFSDPLENPFSMDEATVREELLNFYTEEDVVALERSTWRTELKACYDALGSPVSEDEVVYEEDEVEDIVYPVENVIGYSTEWDTGLEEIRTGAQGIKVVQ